MHSWKKPLRVYIALSFQGDTLRRTVRPPQEARDLQHDNEFIHLGCSPQSSVYRNTQRFDSSLPELAGREDFGVRQNRGGVRRQLPTSTIGHDMT
ncbi:hypothetical protein [Mastigocladopsis repens]|uniref:hypothetical protein n=1 Tax=Mastigocladopsis repens TaxID=221287 RepID=UPI0012EAF049|nr:hypothetical protein [Mastigocladopsis repens]